MGTAPSNNPAKHPNRSIKMPKRRPASSSSQKVFEPSPKVPKSATVLNNPRRSGLRPVPPANTGPLFSLHLESSLQGHKRHWSSDSWDSNSSSSADDGAPSPAGPKEKARSKYAGDFGFLTPATSPQSSFNGYSDPISTQSSLIFLNLPIEVC